MIAPKPLARAEKVSLWRYMRLFRKDLLSAQPARLYRAWMAEFRTPFFRSYLVNQPDLVRLVLQNRPQDFPKSERISAGLRGLLGRSVFLTNGAEWQAQRRIIDPAFEKGRVRVSFPAILEAANAAATRLKSGLVDVEEMASRATADAIFRTLFSIPIDDETAQATFVAFRAYQREQPVLTPAALVPGLSRRTSRRAREAARDIRTLITRLVGQRKAQIAFGTAPDDLATAIMTTADPETGQTFSEQEMVDQVAIFFLAGHETSAAALGWALWLLAASPKDAGRVNDEAGKFLKNPEFSNLSELQFTRNVFREALRLYPPVPMMVREAHQNETLRDRPVRRGSQIVISPWHLHRHTRIWSHPDDFDPSRWETEEGRQCQRDAFIPFSAGPRVCPGAGFAMVEGVVMLAAFMGRFTFETIGDPPVPVAHLTVRSRDGIRLKAVERELN